MLPRRHCNWQSKLPAAFAKIAYVRKIVLSCKLKFWTFSRVTFPYIQIFGPACATAQKISESAPERRWPVALTPGCMWRVCLFLRKMKCTGVGRGGVLATVHSAWLDLNLCSFDWKSNFAVISLLEWIHQHTKDSLMNIAPEFLSLHKTCHSDYITPLPVTEYLTLFRS